MTAAAEALVKEAPDELAQARLLAAQRKESGEWLHAPPMSAIGLRTDDEVLRVAVEFCLGVALCKPHKCHRCGAEVDHLGLHGLSRRRSQGRHPRHAAVNDLLKRSLASAKIPSLLEPTGIARSDGRRPDWISVMPWRNGRTLVWVATCPDTFAPSNVRRPSCKGSRAGGQPSREGKKPEVRPTQFQPPFRSNCNQNIRGFWARGHYFHQGAGSQDQG